MEEPGRVQVQVQNHSCNAAYEEDELVEASLFHFLVMGLGTGLVSLIGIVGNTLSALVLSRPKMKSSLNCLLLGLTFCDMLLILNTVAIMCIGSILEYYGVGRGYAGFSTQLAPYLYAVGMTAQTGSVYFTVAVTVERFIAVCHPLQARSICTWSRAKYYTIGVLLFSVLYNGPRWVEFHALDDLVLMTPLRCDDLYIRIYVQWANLLVMSLLPIVALVVLNGVIYAEIHRTNSSRQVLSKCQTREFSLALMLFMVVAVFLICNILPFVNNFMETMALNMSLNLIDTSNFLVAVNSSVNCFIYCIFGTKFRRECCLLIAGCVPCVKVPPKRGDLTGHTNLHHNTNSPRPSPYTTIKSCPPGIVTSQATLL